ncbi:hypothetical protein MCOR25_003281 [Pyricularia grisea]|uniref:Peptidase A1 domain-containing protein n=1 Tax=Pyricularia grisea TaxID=148305 RepID=A0A6P8B325_PYRGI|nr:uncharacterized protein PgNI_07264 [Pyricularia grisea]KAI6374048.1 hypothetical protein MCOR25_003281 [Pyricularia grisea]TLD09252.1 hypothetical protein PgNI_07264 [Pyricularia grisea]
MATTSLRGLLLLAVAAAAGSLEAAQEPHDPGCLHMPIIHMSKAEQYQKRAVKVPFDQRFDVGYYTKLAFGTPGQEALVHLDTGSFELWIDPTCNNLDGASEQEFCRAGGTYDPAQSTTVQKLGTTNTLRYGIGSANISYVKDTVGIPGTNMSIKNAQFGVATSSETQNAGILGIGHGVGQTIGYRNFIDELKAQNVTKTRAFTVALGGKDEKQGTVVFGGVDTSKFAGGLAKLPIIPAAKSPDGVRRYWIQMSSVSLNPPSGRNKTYSNSSMPVFLDTGSTLTLLPEALVKSVASDFGSKQQDSSGYWPVDCSLVSINGTMDFAFDGVTIKVPYKELIRQFGNSCVLGLSSHSSFTLLGDTFMRSGYFVFDQDADAIWMTQYTNCGSTPAALVSSSSLETLQGACQPKQGSVAAVTAGAAAPSTTGTPKSTSGVGANGSSNPASPSTSAKDSNLKNAGGRAIEVPTISSAVVTSVLAIFAVLHLAL